MTDDRVLELIHREIDGDNSAAESAQLQERLAADPEVRRCCEDFRRLSASLDGMPLSEPPPGLAADILAAIRGKRAGGAPSGEWRSRRSPAWGYVKYAYALAAGLLLGALLSPPLLDRIRGWSTSEVGDLLGTMARSGQPSEPKWHESIDFGAIKGRGTVRLLQSGKLTLAELELRGDTPGQVILEFDAARLELRGFEQPGGAPPLGELSPGRVTWACQGGKRCRFLFARTQAGSAALRIVVTRSGVELYTGSIALPPE